MVTYESVLLNFRNNSINSFRDWSTTIRSIFDIETLREKTTELPLSRFFLHLGQQTLRYEHGQHLFLYYNQI